VYEITCLSSSAEETRAIAKTLATSLRAGDVVMLSGDLGAGKTCFVQGVATGLGVRAHVTSPSFVLVREYPGTIRVIHVDVYRLSSLEELVDLGYEEILARDAITFVEWGDVVRGLLPDDRLEVEIETLDDETRRIVVRASGPDWLGRLRNASLERWSVTV